MSQHTVTRRVFIAQRLTYSRDENPILPSNYQHLRIFRGQFGIVTSSDNSRITVGLTSGPRHGSGTLRQRMSLAKASGSAFVIQVLHRILIWTSFGLRPSLSPLRNCARKESFVAPQTLSLRPGVFVVESSLQGLRQSGMHDRLGISSGPHAFALSPKVAPPTVAP